ncbi:hypothetical protein [Yersinia bercovieri]|uniref:hypothetical protein n=1 Tax=Yersinia bercovieri TaxID=634 RepID=UPI0011AB8190|nr:hypothetical protein [Yersinia bercovieri]
MVKSLDDIFLTVDSSAIPDAKSESETIANNGTEKHPALILQEIEDRKADRALRERFGDKAYKVVRKTLYGWAILLFCYGYSSIFGFKLFPDEIMIAITTAVTLNVFAAFLGVIRGLFPTSKSNKE